MERYQPWSHSLPMPLYEPMCAFFYRGAVAPGIPVVPTPLNLGISAYPYQAYTTLLLQKVHALISQISQ